MQFRRHPNTEISDKHLRIQVLRARCGQLPVVLGSASACDLHAVSFADVLDEATGHGYQRPMDSRHSREFREYIEADRSTTILLTFNLRGENGDGWALDDSSEESSVAELRIRMPSDDVGPVLARVDCPAMSTNILHL